jgi:hypothetical protein
MMAGFESWRREDIKVFVADILSAARNPLGSCRAPGAMPVSVHVRGIGLRTPVRRQR